MHRRNSLKLHLKYFIDVLLYLILDLLALKHEAELLESTVVRLGEEQVYCSDLDEDPDTVHDVILPANRVESDRVDVSVEEYSKSYCQLFDSDTFRSLLERKDLDHVGVCQSVPADVVEASHLCVRRVANKGGLTGHNTYGE